MPVTPNNDYEEIISAGIRMHELEEFKNEDSMSDDGEEIIEPLIHLSSKKVINSCILESC